METHLSHGKGHSSPPNDFSAHVYCGEKVAQLSYWWALVSYSFVLYCYLWRPCVADVDIIFSSCGFFFLLLFSSPNLSGHKLDFYRTSTHGVALVHIKMQVWNVLRASRWKYRTQKSTKNRHLGTITQLCRAISSQLRHVLTIGKKLLSSNISPPHVPTIWWTSAH